MGVLASQSDEVGRSVANVEPSTMSEPLSKMQQSLRGRNVVDMTVDQLRDWIDACAKMERWVTAAKARRSWKQCGHHAQVGLERRDIATETDGS